MKLVTWITCMFDPDLVVLTEQSRGEDNNIREQFAKYFCQNILANWFFKIIQVEISISEQLEHVSLLKWDQLLIIFHLHDLKFKFYFKQQNGQLKDFF